MSRDPSEGDQRQCRDPGAPEHDVGIVGDAGNDHEQRHADRHDPRPESPGAGEGDHPRRDPVGVVRPQMTEFVGAQRLEFIAGQHGTTAGHDENPRASRAQGERVGSWILGHVQHRRRSPDADRQRVDHVHDLGSGRRIELPGIDLLQHLPRSAAPEVPERADEAHQDGRRPEGTSPAGCPRPHRCIEYRCARGPAPQPSCGGEHDHDERRRTEGEDQHADQTGDECPHAGPTAASVEPTKRSRPASSHSGDASNGR